MTTKLTALREQVRQIDDELLKLAARRLELVEQIGAVKYEANLPIKDYQVEKTVLERSRQRAAELGVYPSMAEDLARLLIRYAVIAQDDSRQQLQRQHTAAARKVVVVGGRGRMGRWISDFFDAFGDHVSHVDLPGLATSSRYPLLADLKAATAADIIVLATPISVTPEIIGQLCDLGTGALVFDICSLKTPLLDAIRLASQRGLRIGSAHPMFGPDVDVLVGRNIMICHVSDPAVTSAVRGLFEATTAHLSEVSLERHDELMSYVLGLSHLSNLVFADVLTRGEADFKQLRAAASTTFNAQLGVTVPVTRENADLYFEIQAENGYTAPLLETFSTALKAYSQAIRTRDRGSFVSMMAKARDYFKEV